MKKPPFEQLAKATTTLPTSLPTDYKTTIRTRSKLENFALSFFWCAQLTVFSDKKCKYRIGASLQL